MAPPAGRCAQREPAVAERVSPFSPLDLPSLINGCTATSTLLDNLQNFILDEFL
jgi:hypothetical protein